MIADCRLMIADCRRRSVRSGLILLLVICLGASVVASPLDDQIAGFKNADNQTEAMVANLLKTGLGEGRAAEALVVVRPWLGANTARTQALLYYAGRAMHYSGDWSDAVVFYRKLLKSKSINAQLAASVVPATYRLLMSDMRDTESAYLFMREDGNRLRQYGRARQFDRWFMSEAIRRGDIRALAERLASIHGNPSENPADYAEFMNKLYELLERFEKQGKNTVDALDNLARVATREPGFRARWDWINAVSLYNAEAIPLVQKRKPIPKELLTEPMKAARALLAADPLGGAPLVMKGWSRYNQGHTPALYDYVRAHRDVKAEPFIQALNRLQPADAKRLMNAGGKCPRGRWVPVTMLISPKQIQEMVSRFPQVFNAIDAPGEGLWSKDMTVEQAKALAPHLARNPHWHSAVVRGVAATGSKKLIDVMPVIAKSEAWRFSGAHRQTPAIQMVDTLYHSMVLDRNGVNHRKSQQTYSKEWGSARYHQLKKQSAKDADSKTRMAAFNALYGELRGTPSTPSLFGLWDGLLKHAANADRAKVLQKLTADYLAASGSAKDVQKFLLNRVLSTMDFGNPYSKLTFGPHYAGGWDRWGHSNVRKALPEFAKYLGGLLKQQMGVGTLSKEVFGMWLHCVNPKEKESTAFFNQLIKSPAYLKLGPAYHNMAAHQLLFGSTALTEQNVSDPRIVSRELLKLQKDASAADTDAAFKAVLTRVGQADRPLTVIGLHRIAALPKLTGATRTLALALFDKLSPLGAYPHRQGYEQLALRLIKQFREGDDLSKIMPYAAALWRSAGVPDDNRHDHGNHHVENALISYAEAALQAEQFSTAFSLARCGVRSRVPIGHRLGRLNSVAGRAAVALGAVEITVDETDPDYALHKSNSEFIQGNLDSAWKLYLANSDKLTPKEADPDQKPLLRKLSVEYAFWLLKRNIQTGRREEAEQLVKELTIWSRQEAGSFSLEQEAELKIVLADLAFLKGALPTARAWYRKVADAREYKGSDVHVRAALGSVKVDRVSKNFGAALEELDRLMRIKNPEARIKVHYARAEVMMDQENYKEAFGELDSVLRKNPGHEDAMILRGKIEIQMRRLVEATEIELGVSQEDKVMVPGETLKINLLDPTLSISGVGADIEVEVWAKSGDRERVMLHQLGDSKEKFRADVPTALAPPITGDKTLQVLGVDELRYGYSKRFRAKMKDLPPDPDTVITIASDAHLSFSAGAFPPRQGERKLSIEELGLSSAQAKLGTRCVRPGNPVYLRVIDADKSKSSAVDQLAISLETSSGDIIRRLLLKETGPYTGEFEGIVPTAGAQASAFASEMAPGRDPNMAISSKDYPGWLGNVGDKGKTRTFGVDLNDNVPAQKMTIKWLNADEPITHFVLQTSLNGRDWITRARYPKDEAPWDGRPRVSSFATSWQRSLPVSPLKGTTVPADWREKMDVASVRESVWYVTGHVGGLTGSKPFPIATQHRNGVLLQYRAMFYQPEMATRRFKLTGYPAENTVFLIDGKPAAGTERRGRTAVAGTADPTLIERELRPGLHEIQVWRNSNHEALRKAKPILLCDVPGKGELQPCPEAMFDPKTFPEGIQAMIPQPAAITNVAGGIEVQFGDKTQMRLVRLSIHGFKGVAPGIRKIILSGRDAKVYLPVEQDFMALRDNKQLEVLPGDQIIARYEDDVSATPKRNKHAKSLGVAFNTARISASFLNYETTTTGRRLILEPIRRFNLEDAVAIVVDDVDMDGSPKRDVVDFVAITSAGKKTKLKAVETDPHSGRFVGNIFPVTGAPQRKSELQVPEGGTLTLVYRDMENLDPGIPTDRSVTIEHAKYVTPKLGAYTTTSKLLPRAPVSKADAVRDGAHQTADSRKKRSSGPETFDARRSLAYHYVSEAGLTETSLKAVVGGIVAFDVVAPHLALAGSSEISAYVQVAKSEQLNQQYDIMQPGTLKLTARPSSGGGGGVPKGYETGEGSGPASAKSALDEGRFTFSVPLILGDRPLRSLATASEESRSVAEKLDGLVVQAGDVVRIGYAWKDEQEQLQWKTATASVGSHAFLDVMNGSYNEPLDRVFVGERIFLRVLAPGLDRGPGRDLTSVSLKATSGAAATFTLRETEAHTGVFKGLFTVNYADKQLPTELPPVELNGFPVRYGDEVTVTYPAMGEDPEQSALVAVNMGADGLIEPFSKRFTGDEMAVKTSFTLAECFFELAKKHKKLDQESTARREMAHARKLLKEAIDTHRDDELRAQAEYLLGNLAQEYADLSKNDEAKVPMYQDALARFVKIPTDYPKTEFANKAQFKIGLVYEKMGEAEIAVEEYVKLAYKYPDSEHIPEVMARLGKHFQKTGQTFKEEADPLREKEDVESKSEVLRLDELSYPEFIKAAIIYGKLQERFPDNKLAGLAGLASSQNYMRAHQYEKAIDGFTRVVDTEEYDDLNIRAQALYWSGLSYERLGVVAEGSGGLNEAYETYRRVTFDFPDSKWAKYARGRLSDPAFAKIIEVEEKKREMLLEAIKFQQIKRRQDKSQKSLMDKLLKR